MKSRLCRTVAIPDVMVLMTFIPNDPLTCKSKQKCVSAIKHSTVCGQQLKVEEVEELS